MYKITESGFSFEKNRRFKWVLAFSKYILDFGAAI